MVNTRSKRAQQKTESDPPQAVVALPPTNRRSTRKNPPTLSQQSTTQDTTIADSSNTIDSTTSPSTIGGVIGDILAKPEDKESNDDDFEPFMVQRRRRLPQTTSVAQSRKRIKTEDNTTKIVKPLSLVETLPIADEVKRHETPPAALERDLKAPNTKLQLDELDELLLLTYDSSTSSSSSLASSSTSTTAIKTKDEGLSGHNSELEIQAPKNETNELANTPVDILDESAESDAVVDVDEIDESDDSDESDEGAAPATNRYQRRGGRLSFHERNRIKLNLHHPELKTVWDTLRDKGAKEVRPIDQPKHLKLPLLPFQRYGVAWMIQQESEKDIKGGILADEMGMGKTIQTISLLLSDHGKKPNLIVAPTVAIMQWQSEIETHTDINIKVHVFHGTKRAKTINELKSYDIVITTYAVLENCHRKQKHGVKRNGDLVKEMSLLHKVDWHRIILDEAHNIKDRSCGTARSAFGLNSTYRWSLTGTPLQNRVGELYSLIRFTRADPFGFYFCKSCPCKNLNWTFSDKIHCDQCNHTPMEHVCWWNNEVLKPIQHNGYVGEGRIAMDKLRLLLDQIMLRRTKVECADDLGLPPRTITVRSDVFNEEEEDVYLSLFTDTARRFNSYVENGSVLNNYANIFELLTKMRQCANHPDLVTKKKGISDNKQLVCMLCNDTPEDAILSNCKHTFCRECCVQYLQSYDDLDAEASKQSPRCPSCYASFSVDLTQPAVEIDIGEGEHSAFSKTSIVNRIDMEKWRSSTKIEALAEELTKLRTDDRTIKSIVFSQFVSFLDLIYWRLSRMGFSCIRLDGSMSPKQRAAAIEHFSTNPDTTVFLISLKAGGVALNLTEASRVFICDPWWNPAAELQAMDRIHRLGQHRPILITRLVIENSIESRIIQLQEKKTALVNSTIDKDQAALERLTVDDMKFLFLM